MRILYSASIYLLGIALKIFGVFNEKVKKGVTGRKKTFETLELELNPASSRIWFHCASLGEYEQGLPVFEEIIQKFPDHQIVLSFFSPSGYEIKKNNSIGNIVVYLPLDTVNNAKRFIKLVDPELVIFTKYDIWPNFLIELKKYNSRAYLISALFRKDQSYFKRYGGLMKRALRSFDHIFTQNEESKVLINSVGFNNVSVSGDTRFDRVRNQLTHDNSVDFIKTFTQNKLTIVFGSSWPEDDELFIPFINNIQNETIKFIIAPHKMSKKYTITINKSLNKKAVNYSTLNEHTKTDLEHPQVFIMDTIGYLNKAYSYGHIAYVGGASGKTGLHNILEPAVFGIPIIIGKNYENFPEAKSLIELGGLTSVKTQHDLSIVLNKLISDSEERSRQGQINSDFVKSQSGAVTHIMSHLELASK